MYILVGSKFFRSRNAFQITDAVQKHMQRNVVAPKAVSQRKLDFEHKRPRWMREMAAEALGEYYIGHSRKLS